MSDLTPNLSMPFIQPAQAQKHVTHNEAIEVLDLVAQLTLEAVGTTLPPAVPAEGQAWAVGNGASGDWAGKDSMIASWRGGGWMYVQPREGWLAWARDRNELVVLESGVWQTRGAAPVMQNLPSVGINATADLTNRLSISADATLLNNAGGGHQVKINKAVAGDTASLVYQTGFSGRAEMGLAGNDDFSVKVSPDGASWTNAVSVRSTDGCVQIAALLNLTPATAPASPIAGDIYFDSASAKLRCYDGTGWNNLF